MHEIAKSETHKQEFIASLQALFGGMPPVSAERDNVNIFNKAREAYLFTVRNILNNIIKYQILSDDEQEQQFQNYITEIDAMLIAKKKSALIVPTTEDAPLAEIPEHIKEEITFIEQQAAMAKEEFTEQEIIETFSDPQDKRNAALYFILKGPDTRIPVKGTIPEDLVEQRKVQSAKVDDIIKQTLEVLES